MRHVLLSTALALVAMPAIAEQIDTTAPVRKVTLYPWGASVTRVADLSAPAGVHEIIIPGLPADLDASSLRLSAKGASIGAVSLQTGRALPKNPQKSEEITAAEAEVRRLENALAARDQKAALIEARAKAAQDTITFLLGLAENDGANLGDIAGLAGSVSQQALQAHETVVNAEAEARLAQQGREDEVAVLAAARARLEALQTPDEDAQTLVMSVETGAQPAQIEITGFTQNASWQPVYDLRLATEEKQLELDRGLLVSQHSGEDWRGVELTLSTARPSDRSAPSELEPWFPRAENPPSLQPQAAPMARMKAESAYDDAMVNVEAVVVETAQARMMGATVVYDYPAPVDIRTGADALRLKLDSQQLTPEIVAEAVPRRDSSAYLVADTTNSTQQVILPGEATLYLDGAMVGQRALDLTAAGDDLKIGFGPIDGIQIERTVPEEAEGGRGFISKSNTRRETSVLKIRNLTAQEWPLRVIDQVPVSTQDDLQVDWSASPSPDETDPDGKRGLLVWNAPIAAEEEREITLTVDMNWPEGKDLLNGTN